MFPLDLLNPTAGPAEGHPSSRIDEPLMVLGPRQGFIDVVAGERRV